MHPTHNDIFNYKYIQRQAQKRHSTQIAKIQESANKLKDFIDSTYEIDPDYKDEAWKQFFAIIGYYLGKNSG